MILGIGVDIVSISRISDILAKYNTKFIERILSKKEQKIFFNHTPLKHVHFLSKRFACKEAISKALGLGIGRPYRFHDIEILNNNLGKPYVNFLGVHNEIDSKCKFNISISDEKTHAIAFVVISV